MSSSSLDIMSATMERIFPRLLSKLAHHAPGLARAIGHVAMTAYYRSRIGAAVDTLAQP
jgi:hypothetical protein